jgi:aryl-alcohol dehydrogenase-like predicted oxidoreductase
MAGAGSSRWTVLGGASPSPAATQPDSGQVRMLPMRFRRLGSSDLQVSEIALGSWLTYGGGVADDAARACIDKAFDVGINFFDTSNVYGRGAAEALLGDVLQSRPRDSYVLATKLFFPMDDTGENQGLSRGRSSSRSTTRSAASARNTSTSTSVTATTG